ncbi:mediator complex subunit MED21 [Besnoitia besnoiti]|uniref:Mediator complex subunit MED21 n=1 Tax=Besnoitia besnoiti TaxID=94643 RepID=A0A2A9MG29_BESBE|nr:mediator complex subunit MED21 [Besnoitia besnoiti]PFH34926.1 mediator complex subunit MED21 [Besnoitia besnoiti]
MLPVGASPPFPSPQASDAVSRLQLLLTNFSSHLYDVVQQVPELAPPQPVGPAPPAASAGEEEAEKKTQLECFLLRSANNVATIMHAIEAEIENLPSSLRKREETQARIAFLEKENRRAAVELEALAAQTEGIRQSLRQALRQSLTENTHIVIDE